MVVLAIALGKVDDERNSGAGVVKPAFGTRESDAMIGPEEDDGVFGEAVFLELGKKVAGPGVHCGDDFVVALPVFAHGWGVRIVWRQGGELGGVLTLGARKSFGNGLIF